MWFFYFNRSIAPCLELKRTSVRASTVNEIWHMDVSHFKTEDNIRFYIYTVVDNFSRRIIKYDVSTLLSAKMRLNSLKEAIHDVFAVDLDNSPSLDLIVDGGSENNNVTIHDFIRSCHVNIKKKIALRDVMFSNSIVEAPYRILKSGYFQNRPILSTTIKQEMEFFVHDYNNNRPHYAHMLYTPNEVAQNPELLNVKPTLQRINRERLENNRAYCCKIK
ncbi:MAG: DDE-type integrase/transposase/recombinase [Owenweeksia sp.]